MIEDVDRMMREEKERIESHEYQQALESQAIYARMPSNGWQKGCPFLIDDVVMSSERHGKIGKVIGLPTKDDAEAQDDFRVNKAWILFEDDTRVWVLWTDLKHVRRSPAREKRPPPATPQASFQTKLFATSRKRLIVVETDSPSSSADGSTQAQAPEAAIERDRVAAKKPPVGARGYQKAGHTTRETSISIASRINEFPNQGLRDSGGKLFCGACLATLPNIKSSIVTHMGTAKHLRRLELFNARTSNDVTLMAELEQYFKANPQLAGGTNVTANDQLFRYRVVESLLMAGVPVEKADHLRVLFERSGRSSVSASHLRHYIPKVEANGRDLLVKENKSKLVVINFDGTSRDGELKNAVARWTTFDFYLKQRLVVLKTFARHMNAAQLAAFLTQLLLRDLGCSIMDVIGFLRDSAAVNGAAVATLCNTFTAAENLLCFPHTLCHVGEHFEFDLLDAFLSLWVKLVYSSPRAKAIWRELIGEGVVGLSEVRWYCKAEIILQQARNFEKIAPCLSHFEAEDIGQVLTPKLKDKYNEDTSRLRRQYATMLDMRLLIATTYNLEGDGLAVMLAYERIEALRQLGRSVTQPGILVNLAAVIRSSTPLIIGTEMAKDWPGYGLCTGNIIAIGNVMSSLYPNQIRTAYTVKYNVDGTTEDLEQEEIRPLLTVHAADVAPLAAGLAPGFTYLENRLTGNCQANYSCEHSCAVLSAIRAFDPNYAAAHVTPAHVQGLAVVRPIAARNLIERLLAELPTYLALAAAAPPLDHSSVTDYTAGLLLRWRTHHPRMPVWAEAARIALALSCTSAASERVFSLVEGMFGADQVSALADQLQAAVMLRYNKRQVG